jgi:hypothetical protein
VPRRTRSPSASFCSELDRRLPGIAHSGQCGRRVECRPPEAGLVEKIVVGAVQEQIADPEHIAYVLLRVEEAIAKLRSDLPNTLKLKEAELTAEQRRQAHFVDFIG